VATCSPKALAARHASRSLPRRMDERNSCVSVSSLPSGRGDGGVHSATNAAKHSCALNMAGQAAQAAAFPSGPALHAILSHLNAQSSYLNWASMPTMADRAPSRTLALHRMAARIHALTTVPVAHGSIQVGPNNLCMRDCGPLFVQLLHRRVKGVHLQQVVVGVDAALPAPTPTAGPTAPICRAHALSIILTASGGRLSCDGTGPQAGGGAAVLAGAKDSVSSAAQAGRGCSADGMLGAPTPRTRSYQSPKARLVEAVP
jgi:hypothetical protein